MQLHKADVLVIGSGAAGLRAAIEVHDSGTDVIVVGKCKKGDAHTVLATGGINAALRTMDKHDNWLVHAADTLREGRFIADYRAVEILCKYAPAGINDLVKYGVPFARDKRRKIIQRTFGAHSYPRTSFVGDETGKAIEAALVKQAKKRKFLFFGEIYIISLLTSGNHVNGAIGFSINSGEIVVFSSKCVVLATGGHSRLYRRSSSRIYENTGDGIALAFNVGAELQDMEMVQFHPTGMVYPEEAEGVLVTEAVRAEGGRLFNAKNERFMKRYDSQRMELGPRDEVARAIYNEIKSHRGTEHSGVWLDITHLPKNYIVKRLPKMYRQFQDYLHLDISKERMEVAPTAHYSMGGIRVNLDSSTNVDGLFAVGEVAGGLHGSNRLGGNSLAETVVFGKIVGRAVVKYAKKHLLLPVNYLAIKHATLDVRSFLGKESLRRPQDLRKELQELMWKKVGIIRKQKEMETALKKIQKLKWKLATVRVGNNMGENPDLAIVLDVKNLLLTAESVVRSALMRKESRGAHYRSDYPKESKKWLVNIACKKSAHGIILHKVKVAKPKGPFVKELKMKREMKHGMLE